MNQLIVHICCSATLFVLLTKKHGVLGLFYTNLLIKEILPSYVMSYSSNDEEIKCVGLPHHEPASIYINPHDTIYLYPEPNNEHDSNAVIITNRDNTTIGYVQKECAREVQQYMFGSNMHRLEGYVYKKVLENQYLWIKIDVHDNSFQRSCSKAIRRKPKMEAKPKTSIRNGNQKLSKQHNHILIAIVIYGLNVLVNAIQGSGKTTISLRICQQLPSNTHALIITYNKKLKDETRERANELELGSNVEILNYHSLALKYYVSECKDDNQLKDILEQDTNLKYNMINRFDSAGKVVLIIDEAQDMRPDYFELIFKFVRDMNILPSRLQLLVIGDADQWIYGYKKADSRFLTKADELFKNLSYRKWEKLKINTSYRITHSIAAFINALHGKNTYKAIKHGDPVTYLVCNSFGSYLHDYIYKLTKSYDVQDIIILAQSLSGYNCAPKKLENYLKKTKGVDCYYPDKDSDCCDENIIKNKLVFSSFHKAKGIERKVVVVFNMCDSYIEYYLKDQEDRINAETKPPNVINVACGRAIEKLIVIHDSKKTKKKLLPRTCLPRIYKALPKLEDDGHVEMIYDPELTSNELYEYEHPDGEKKLSKLSATDLLRHVNDDIITRLSDKIDVKQISEPDIQLNIPTTVPSTVHDAEESVADINGIVLPAIYQFRKTGTCNLLQTQNKQQVSKFLPEDWLRCGAEHVSHRNNIVSRNMQIKKFDWLKQKHIDIAFDRLCSTEKYDTEKDQREFEIHYEVEDDSILGHPLHISGSVDMISGISGNETHIWEYKCVDSLRPINILQLAIYAWLHLKENGTPPAKMFLFNIRSNEILQLTANSSTLNEILRELIVSHFKSNKRLSDEEFLSERENSIQKYL